MGASRERPRPEFRRRRSDRRPRQGLRSRTLPARQARPRLRPTAAVRASPARGARGRRRSGPGRVSASMPSVTRMHAASNADRPTPCRQCTPTRFPAAIDSASDAANSVTTGRDSGTPRSGTGSEAKAGRPARPLRSPVAPAGRGGHTGRSTQRPDVFTPTLLLVLVFGGPAGKPGGPRRDRPPWCRPTRRPRISWTGPSGSGPGAGSWS